MNRFAIDLTENEQALVDKIDLRLRHASWEEGHAAYNNNKKPICDLLKSLSKRNGIPRERLNYWNDPNYQSGRIKASHKGLFERNGCTGEDIYEHPHFIKHLRYFLFGPDLPEEVMAAFENEAPNPKWVTSGDIVPIGKLARRLVRERGLEKHHAAEEFFKLGLDLGYGLSTASRLKRAIMQ